MQITMSSVPMAMAPVAMNRNSRTVHAPQIATQMPCFVAKNTFMSKRRLAVKALRATTITSEAKTEGPFIPVMRPEDLPKGTRKEVRVEGKGVLIFWYRNMIYAIESRSPAEGAYSEGFIRAKFTQDFAIECPSTGSLFSLRDGSILSWYPNNAVLKMLTPQSTCRNLEIYPVKLNQDAIAVDISNSTTRSNNNATKGGSDTSLENNNVYGLEPKVYVEGAEEQESSSSSNIAQVATTGVSVLGVSAVVLVSIALVKYISQ